MVAADSVAVSHIANLAPRLLELAGFRDVVQSLHAGNGVTIDGAWGSSAALVVSALTLVAPSSVVVVLPRERELDDFVADVASFGIGGWALLPVEPGAGAEQTGKSAHPPMILPAWASLPQELSISDPILGGRLRVVRGFESDAPPRVVVSTMPSLLQPMPSREERKVASRQLKVGTDLDLDDMAAWLIGRGFERVTALEVPGEFSIHGGIVDIFPPDSSDPVRIELFGDEIESIRLFNVETQRKVASVDEIAITVLSPSDPNVPLGAGRRELPCRGDDDIPDSLPPRPGGSRHPAQKVAGGEHVLDSLPAGAWIVLVEMEEVVREGKQYLDRLADRKGLFSVESTLERCAARPHVNLAPLIAGSYATTFHLPTQSIEKFGGAKGEALRELERVVQQDESVLIACHNEAARQRLTELLAEIYNDPSLIAAPQQAGVQPKDSPPPAPTGPPLRRFLRGKTDAAAVPPTIEKVVADTAPPNVNSSLESARAATPRDESRPG